MVADRLSAAQARRIALGAQGFARSRPRAATLGPRHGKAVFDQVGIVQLDSVNVVARSHELTLFARLGGHPRDLMASMVERRDVFEYWAHEASFVPVELQPLLRWRMDAAEQGVVWRGLTELAAKRPGFVASVYDEVRDRGPLTSSQLSEPGGKTGPWWGWNETKQALAYLFWCGRITSRARLNNFERLYDLPERVIPAPILAQPSPSRSEAQRQLLLVAARAHGVATAADLGDYFRLPIREARARIEELVEDAQLRPVVVDGWSEPAYLHPEAALPRQVSATALLSPFDSLIWARPRTERLFGFHYRLEIYTPPAKRRFGYYVLPFLLGDRLVARVDLKADRHGAKLLVQAAHAEPGIDVGATAAALHGELVRLATWLGLSAVVVEPRGDLALALGAAMPT